MLKRCTVDVHLHRICLRRRMSAYAGSVAVVKLLKFESCILLANPNPDPDFTIKTQSNPHPNPAPNSYFSAEQRVGRAAGQGPTDAGLSSAQFSLAYERHERVGKISAANASQKTLVAGGSHRQSNGQHAQADCCAMLSSFQRA